MKKRKQTTKITIALLTILSLTLLMVGCGETTSETSVGNDEAQAVTEAANVEAEEPTEDALAETETEEPTEVVEPEKEEEIIAVGSVIATEGYPMVVENPSLTDWGEKIGTLRYGDKVNIIEEYYNEEEQFSYYRIRLENGKKGYVAKEDILIEE